MLRSLTLTALLGAPALLAQAPSLDKILAQHYQAMGGLEKLQALKTMRAQMKMLEGPMELPLAVEMVLPDKMRVDVSVQGMTIIQAVNGPKGWKIDPTAGYGGGKAEPEPMTPEEVKQFEGQLDFQGDLVDYKAKGHGVEYLGLESVEGSPAHKLKLTKKGGTLDTIWLDADSFLILKQSSKSKVRDQEMETETTLGDYKSVGGIMVNHTTEVQPKGSPQKRKMILEKVEFNVVIDSSRFQMPEKPKVAAPEAKK